MTTERPPTIDPVAAARWQRHAAQPSPWLHDEVARRMHERLDWIKLQPATWGHWAPLTGGVSVHALLTQRYAAAQSYVIEATDKQIQAAKRSLTPPWWRAAHWRVTASRFETPGDESLQMLWANMALHMAADPQALIAQWHKLLAVDGFLMFSCLGPDTLRELRSLYQRQGWPAPAHEFTDMHDWGDMLVAAGFAEPVLDMERIVLSFDTPERLLLELRGLGRNLHAARSTGLRGRKWLSQLHRLLRTELSPDSRAPSIGAADAKPLTLTFEVIYGHALKPARRLAVRPEMTLSLEEMRARLGLRGGQNPTDGRG